MTTTDGIFTIACGICGTTELRPPNDGRSWAPLYEAGWRWAGRTTGGLKFCPDVFAFSCPACPPVVVVLPERPL